MHWSSNLLNLVVQVDKSVSECGSYTEFGMVNFRQYTLAMIIFDENSFSIGNLGTCFLLLCNVVARYETKNMFTPNAQNTLW